jgi:curved DNA-binding protein CbpA
MLQAEVVGQPNYYDLLQVAPEAGQTEIRSAYRQLSRQYHPDSNTPAASERLQQEINAAWDVLGSPLARAQYDRQLARIQPKPIRSTEARSEWRTAAEAEQGPADKQPEPPAEKVSREPQGSVPRPPESTWQRANDDELEWAAERRRTEKARIREELERQRREEERATLTTDPSRLQYQRIMREREIRTAAERARQQSGAPVPSEAGRQEAAEQARERLRLRRQQLFISRE